MDDFGCEKTEISDRLEREVDSLGALKDALSRSDTMTHNMLGILSSFEGRLSRLEETIMPIYQETGNLQRRHENVERTLTALDHVIGYYHVAEEVEPIIRDDPGNGLAKYLECMNKLQKAVDYFTSNSPGSAEMSQVTTLYEAGKDDLEREFRQLLTSHSKPLTAITILNVLAAEEEGTAGQKLEQLSPRVHKDLCDVATWLLQCGITTDYMQVYSSIRSSVLVRTLHGVKDHYRSSSKDSGNQSPAMRLKSSRDTPSKAKSLKGMDFVRRASTTLKKHMVNMEAAGIVRQGSTIPELYDANVEMDIDFYITAISALLKLIQSEWQLMQGITPEKHQRRVFDQLIKPGLDYITKEGEQISSYIKHSLVRQQHSSVINIFPVLKHLRTVKPEFDRTLEGCQTSTRTTLVSLISMLDCTGAKALEEFVNSIRNDPDKSCNMPPDGTVHELTNNTMILLEQMLEYADTAGSMLLTQDPTSLPNVQNTDRPKLKLAEYVIKVLSSLGLNLNNKSETYSDTTLRAVFMLNNYNYMLKSLRSSGLLGLIHSWNDEVEIFYEDQVLNQKRIYSQRTGLIHVVHKQQPDAEQSYCCLIEQQQHFYHLSWSRVLHFIQQKEGEAIHRPGMDGKLKDKDKQAIKDKFTGFNREVEEVYRTQSRYAIPDTELRDDLKQENKEYILPFYRQFLRTYRNTNFTKNPEKYIKYTESDIADFVNKFFDSSA